MSTPMYDTPEHLWIALTKDGDGPVEVSDPDFHHYGCWCGNPTCRKAGNRQ